MKKRPTKSQQTIKQRKSKTKNKILLPDFLIKRLHEGGFILVLMISIFILLALGTYESQDLASSHSHHGKEALNAGGQIGAYLADILLSTFGYLAYLLPTCFTLAACFILKSGTNIPGFNKYSLLLRVCAWLFLMFGASGLLSLNPTINILDLKPSAGGTLGNATLALLLHVLGNFGSILVLISSLLLGATLLTGLSWLRIITGLSFYSLLVLNYISRVVAIIFQQIKLKFKHINLKNKSAYSSKKINSNSLKINTKLEKLELAAPTIIATTALKKATLKLAVQKESNKSKDMTIGLMPSLTLLEQRSSSPPMGGYTHLELETLSRDVEQHLLDFGIQADVVAVHPGPVITRFELQMAAGIKVSKLTSLAKDLARSLSVSSVRVVEVIPGKTVVGLELPNQSRAMVCLAEVLTSATYQQSRSPLTLALGVDIAGTPVILDLAKMPHLLVAGTTGSGKSVGINAMILSLLFKSNPESLRLIMIDPKMLELSVYEGIPHLLTPVVTDMKEAAAALRWCVAEMDRRYRLMAALGVRNLAGYNFKVEEAIKNDAPLVDPLWKPKGNEEDRPTLAIEPYVVVIIDELADMMMVVGKKVEQLIARIAQKARASGIHLILATQRPSVDVLTGLIKSNIPTRISFQVSSKIDSRTILDQQGAEQLLGHGDMLYLAPGAGAPLRIHGAFVDDKEVHRVADDWRIRGGEPNYIIDILQTPDVLENGFNDDNQDVESDKLYDEAVAFVTQTRKASISAVQRRLKIGYNRAARLIEIMEQRGLIGPLECGVRDVLVPFLEE